ncbi:hypothetical protein [Oleidesulfovibrio sp.]|uniref:hypothetical protein n=1 Tax=Oleidesulfovibrio sp. TaxID=2909707 RepID=UPI003A8C532E
MSKATITFASGFSCEGEISFQEETREKEPSVTHAGRGVYGASGTVEISGSALDSFIFDVLFPEQEGVTTWQ